MTELLGKSVGEWSANENVNFGGGFGNNNNNTKNCDALILPNWRQCGLSLSEWSRRAGANSSLKSKGLTSIQIARYWKKFRDEVQSTFNSSLFISYALEENAKEYDASQNQGGARGGRGNSNTNVNTDRNGKPTTDKGTAGGNVAKPNSGSLANSILANPTTPPTEKSNTNLYIYGGVGLAVIVGAFLIFRKK